jgi:hypothetical protein
MNGLDAAVVAPDGTKLVAPIENELALTFIPAVDGAPAADGLNSLTEVFILTLPREIFVALSA